MPINRKWNLEQLMTAAREFPLRNREKITFEYVLLKGVNDSPEHARELAELLRGDEVQGESDCAQSGAGNCNSRRRRKTVWREFQKISNQRQCAGIYSSSARDAIFMLRVGN